MIDAIFEQFFYLLKTNFSNATVMAENSFLNRITFSCLYAIYTKCRYLNPETPRFPSPNIEAYPSSGVQVTFRRCSDGIHRVLARLYHLPITSHSSYLYTEIGVTIILLNVRLGLILKNI